MKDNLKQGARILYKEANQLKRIQKELENLEEVEIIQETIRKIEKTSIVIKSFSKKLLGEDIIYKEIEPLKEKKTIQEIRKDFYEIDKKMYEAVLLIVQSKEYQTILKEKGLKINLPEKYMVDCRESLKELEDKMKK